MPARRRGFGCNPPTEAHLTARAKRHQYGRGTDKGGTDIGTVQSPGKRLRAAVSLLERSAKRHEWKSKPLARRWKRLVHNNETLRPRHGTPRARSETATVKLR